MESILDLLNQEHNFHLSFKVIQVDNEELFKKARIKLHEKQIRFYAVEKEKNLYLQLKEAYEQKVDYLLIDETITLFNPLYLLLQTPHFDLIKPCTQVLYSFHDNVWINKLKFLCSEKKAVPIHARKVYNDSDLSLRDENNLLHELLINL